MWHARWLFLGVMCLLPRVVGADSTCPSRWASLVNKLPLGGAGLTIFANARSILHMNDFASAIKLLRGLPKLHEILDFQKFSLDSPLIHKGRIRELVGEKDFESRLTEFQKRLSGILRSTSTEQAQQGETVWDVALEVNGKDRDKALDFMMVLVQDHVAAERGIVKEIEKGPAGDQAQQLWQKVQDARSFIYHLELHGTAFRTSGEGPREQPRLSYPDKSGPSDLSHFYHFYSAAYLAKELVKKGVDRDMARYLAIMNGDFYEKFMYATEYLPLSKGLKHLVTRNEFFSVEEKLDHPYHHIALHLRGAFFGVDGDPAKIPDQKSAYEFIKKNFWSRYAALADGGFKLTDKKLENDPPTISSALKKLSPARAALLLATLALDFDRSRSKLECVPMRVGFQLVRTFQGKQEVLGQFAGESECHLSLQAANSR